MCCDRKCPLTWLLEGAQRRSPSQIIAIWAIAAIRSAPGLHFCVACEGFKKATGSLCSNQIYSIIIMVLFFVFSGGLGENRKNLKTRKQTKQNPKKTKYPSNKPNSVRGEKPMQGIQATLATEAMTDQTGSNGMSPDQVLIPGPLKQNLQDRQRRISRGCYKILLQEVPDGIPEELSYKHWYRQRTFKIFKILILPQGPLRGLKIKIFTPGTLRI